MAKRDEKLKELENPEHWDFENVERRRGVKRPRAIVSVAFPADDYELVARRADELGLKLSEFIRAAALDRASSSGAVVEVFSIGVASAVVSGPLGSTTKVRAEIKEADIELPITA